MFEPEDNKEDIMEEANDNTSSPPLHTSKVASHAKLNIAFSTIQSIAILFLFYYRVSWFFQEGPTSGFATILSWTLISVSEFIFSFIWLLSQACRWRPIRRAAFPERLSRRLKEEDFPAIDVFICTADPEKEPPVTVMNTVISAMCFEYPWEKVQFYLSDDAGSPVTLYALREAAAFAKSWLPFCKKHGVMTRCPELYFSEFDAWSKDKVFDDKFIAEVESMRLMYNVFQEKVIKAKETDIFPTNNDGESYSTWEDKRNHPSMVKIILEKQENSNEEGVKMPMLVYVAREKRPGFPHHFKAGALNVLLRVSGIMSNSPYIMVLDCDMYTNDPSIVLQAMCFFTDPQVSRSLAFIQFPQSFRGLSENDLYDGGMRNFCKVMLTGHDGLEGPILSGTGFFLDRNAIYGWRPGCSVKEELTHNLPKALQNFGSSNNLIASMCGKKPEFKDESSAEMELAYLASCNYEKDTSWGTERGFLYQSVVEDFFTGFNLHCRGWKSIFCSPSRPPFLGSAPNNFHDTLVQYKRWMSGFLEVAFSRYCPLIYGMKRTSPLQSMCYAHLAFLPFFSLALTCYGFIPQLCLLNGVSLYPTACSPSFALFVFLLASSCTHYIWEVISSGGSLRTWWNEQRMWMMRGVSSIFSLVQIMLKLMGSSDIPFEVTSKTEDEEQVNMYEKEVMYFGEASSPLFIPIVTIATINMLSFIGGAGRLFIKANFGGLLVQLLLSSLILVFSCPVYEAMALRQDKGRIAPSITHMSVVISFVTIVVGSICFHL